MIQVPESLGFDILNSLTPSSHAKVTSVKLFKVFEIQKDIWKIQQSGKDKFEFMQKKQRRAKVRVI